MRKNRLIASLLILMSFSFSGCQKETPRIGNGTFEIRLGSETEQPDSKAIHLIGSPDDIYVGSKVFLIHSDIVSARIIETGEQEIIEIEFSKEAQKILAKVTAKNSGQRLCVIMNNSLVSAPVIRDKITGPKTQIAGQGVPMEFMQLVDMIKAR